MNWILINGEKESKVTMHYVTEKIDEGPVLDYMPISVSQSDTINDLSYKSLASSKIKAFFRIQLMTHVNCFLVAYTNYGVDYCSI